jgi:hypothetical protein
VRHVVAFCVGPVLLTVVMFVVFGILWIKCRFGIDRCWVSFVNTPRVRDLGVSFLIKRGFGVNRDGEYYLFLSSSVKRDVCVSTRCDLVLSFLVEMCMVFGCSRTIPGVEILIEFWSSRLLCVYNNARRASKDYYLTSLGASEHSGIPLSGIC